MPRVRRSGKNSVSVGLDGEVVRLVTCAWCKTGMHGACRPKYQRFYFDTKRGKTVLVWLDEYVKCDCKTCTKEKK